MAVTVVVYDQTKFVPWDVAKALEEIETMNFGRDGFTADFIMSELRDKSGAVVLLMDGGVVVGYTSATDADGVYTSNSYYYGRDHEDVAYNSNSSIHPDYQHKGYIWMLMDLLESALKAKGYKILDTDAKSDLGFADKVVSKYGERVVFAQLPVRTMWGHQRYIRIKL